MQEIFTIATDAREGLYDITGPVEEIVAWSATEEGICSLYVRGATAAVMIQENWDESVQSDVVKLLRPGRLVPQRARERVMSQTRGARG
jgi:thiamine phosphate synthase YjbQ (UPF0047 family)